MNTLYHLVIILAAIAGFYIAYRIRHKKKKGPFVCPMNFDCHTVVTSEYSKVLGIPLEFIGMTYYALVAVSYSLFLALPELKVAVLYTQSVLVLSIAAFLFSMYLTAIQAFKLKQWCTYCLFSAGMCTIIFLAVMMLSRIV